jgi:hypothetical protein
LAIDSTDEDLLLASVDERGKFLESVSVLMDWHAQEDDVGIRDNILVVVAQGIDITVEFLFALHVFERWEVIECVRESKLLY